MQHKRQYNHRYLSDSFLTRSPSNYCINCGGKVGNFVRKEKAFFEYSHGAIEQVPSSVWCGCDGKTDTRDDCAES
jgi:hypothetical protein